MIKRSIQQLYRNRSLPWLIVGFLLGILWASGQAGASPPSGLPNSQASLDQRVAALEELLAHFSRVKDDVFITGANLHVVNGEGSTESN